MSCGISTKLLICLFILFVWSGRGCFADHIARRLISAGTGSHGVSGHLCYAQQMVKLSNSRGNKTCPPLEKSQRNCFVFFLLLWFTRPGKTRTLPAMNFAWSGRLKTVGRSWGNFFHDNLVWNEPKIAKRRRTRSDSYVRNHQDETVISAHPFQRAGLEPRTTRYLPTHAMWKNSNQAAGCSWIM